MKALYVVVLAAALAAPSPAAVAKDKGGKGKPAKADKDKGNKGNKPDKAEKADQHADHGSSASGSDRMGKVVIADDDRRAARDWYRSSSGRNCPPGLAKKNNGCLPPGQAKKRYAVGSRLPDDILIKTIPTGLRLSPAPPGYRYGYVDGDVLLVNTTSRVVADVIERILD